MAQRLVFENFSESKIVGIPASVLKGIEYKSFAFSNLSEFLRLLVCCRDRLVHENYARWVLELWVIDRVTLTMLPCFESSLPDC